MKGRDKVKTRLDALEKSLIEGRRLGVEKGGIEDIVDSVSKFFSIMSYEDRDFLNAARHAIEDGLEWK